MPSLASSTLTSVLGAARAIVKEPGVLYWFFEGDKRRNGGSFELNLRLKTENRELRGQAGKAGWFT